MEYTADVLGGKNSREKKRASAGRAEMRSMILDMSDALVGNLITQLLLGKAVVVCQMCFRVTLHICCVIGGGPTSKTMRGVRGYVPAARADVSCVLQIDDYVHEHMCIVRNSTVLARPDTPAIRDLNLLQASIIPTLLHTSSFSIKYTCKGS